MSLTFDFQGARDLFEKLKRDGEAITTRGNGDSAFNFCVTAYHLLEWIRKDPLASGISSSEISALQEHKLLRACRDLANASKHFRLKTGYKNQVVKDSSVQSQGWGNGPWGSMPWGGGDFIVIELSDGSSYYLDQFRDGVLGLYEAFFADHSL